MKKEKSNSNSWFIEALQLMFIAFKLTGVIDWNWIWVLCPFWGSLTIVTVFAIAGVALSRIKQAKGGDA